MRKIIDLLVNQMEHKTHCQSLERGAIFFNQYCSCGYDNMKDQIKHEWDELNKEIEDTEKEVSLKEQADETKLIYIDDTFYSETKTIMSPIYAENGTRYDWGFVSQDLRDGKKISIRQATVEELESYNKRKQEILNK